MASPITLSRTVLLLAAVLSVPVAATAVTPCPPPTASEQQAAAAAVSSLRRAAGLPALRNDPVLAAAAARQACAMAASGRMAHSGQGRGPGHALKRAGYRYSVVSENVAMGNLDLGRVMGAWRASPRHMSNMMIPQIRDMGIAVATGPNGRTRYWAAVFAARQ